MQTLIDQFSGNLEDQIAETNGDIDKVWGAVGIRLGTELKVIHIVFFDEEPGSILSVP